MCDWKARTNQKEHNRKIWLKRAYDMTPHELAALFTEQKGVCAICHEPLTDKYHIDHNHQTGALRGLLCRSCNVGLGFFKDSTSRLLAGVRYLRTHPS